MLETFNPSVHKLCKLVVWLGVPWCGIMLNFFFVNTVLYWPDFYYVSVVVVFLFVCFSKLKKGMLTWSQAA